ncbi:MAG TPA: hypothetical protein VJU61_09030 [Polyangiaceae bacterium]|nr:hypothetical protein [Polyangiaceae bacterium]
MHNKEMPIVVRLSQTELVQALGPSDDSSVQRMGGLTVILRAIQVGPERATVPDDLIGAIGGPPALRTLAAAFRTVEQSLFRRLKADPALARRFVLDPGSALAELGLAPSTCQAEIGITPSATEAAPAASSPLRSNPLRS